MKTEFAIADNSIPVKVRTRKEAAQLLRDLRAAYQSLRLDQRHEAKNLIADLWESHRRFGPAFVAPLTAGLKWRANG